MNSSFHAQGEIINNYVLLVCSLYSFSYIATYFLFFTCVLFKNLDSTEEADLFSQSK